MCNRKFKQKVMCFLLPKQFKNKTKPEVHSLTRNFDDNDVVVKTGAKEVAHFAPDFFNDVHQMF